jgi:hypothetical protein
MAGGLPADLIEETASTLGSVGRVSLPPEQWPAVQLVLRAADHAVDTDDADALRAALDELHRVGLASQYFDDSPTGAQAVIVDPMPAPPRPYVSPSPPGAGPVGYGPIPVSPHVAGAPPPSSPRAKPGRVWVGVGVFVVALFAVVLLGLLNTKAHNASSPSPPDTSATMTASPSVTGGTSPTQASPTPSTTATSPTGTPTGKGAGAGLPVALGLIAMAVLVVATVVVLVRRRSRPRHAPPVQLVDAAEPPGRPAFIFAPNELVELANRTVDRLVAKGGGP